MKEPARKDRSKMVEEEISHLSGYVASDLIDHESKSPDPLLRQYQKYCLQGELQNHLINFKRRLEKGVYALLQGVGNISHKESVSLIHEAFHDLSRLIIVLLHLPHNLDKYSHLLEQRISLQLQCKISDEILELLYRAAKSLYLKGHYQEASDAFGVLTLLNSERDLFWIGFANSEYSCARYETAYVGYSIASYINPFNPALYIFTCKSLEATSNFDNIINACNLTLEMSRLDKDKTLLKKVMNITQKLLRKAKVS